jgi:hypothetical protein
MGKRRAPDTSVIFLIDMIAFGPLWPTELERAKKHSGFIKPVAVEIEPRAGQRCFRISETASVAARAESKALRAQRSKDTFRHDALGRKSENH